MPILTRQELYDLVWSTPMSKLAENFGISDVGLSKICDRHRVPAPPRGYWAKKEAGKPVKQTIFVQVDDPLLDRITIDSAREKLPPPVREIIERRRAERNAAKRKRTRSVMAPPPVERVTDPHPAVRATATALRRAIPSVRGVIEAIGPGLGGISIGVDSVERIIAFLDSLARACEARGMHLVAEERRMAVVVGDDDASFEITEKTKQVPHVLTKAEIAAEENRRKRNERIARGHWDTAYDFDPLAPKFDTVRTGQIGLRVFGYGDGLRWSWNDGKMQTLETLLDDIVVGFEAHIANIRLRREKQERADAEQRELERRHDLAKARRQRESDRKQLLGSFIRTRRRADQLRDWIAFYEPMASINGDLRRMIAWARSELSVLETSLEPSTFADELNVRKLFPEVDELIDPLGEPPPQRPWYL
jgi:hypothetical protein